MIDPKINIRSKPTHFAERESLVKGNAAIARADAEVQTRAYELYELRGRTDGHAEEDWYQAQTDLRETANKRSGLEMPRAEGAHDIASNGEAGGDKNGVPARRIA